MKPVVNLELLSRVEGQVQMLTSFKLCYGQDVVDYLNILRALGWKDLVWEPPNYVTQEQFVSFVHDRPRGWQVKATKLLMWSLEDWQIGQFDPTNVVLLVHLESEINCTRLVVQFRASNVRQATNMLKRLQSLGWLPHHRESTRVSQILDFRHEFIAISTNPWLPRITRAIIGHPVTY